MTACILAILTVSILQDPAAKSETYEIKPEKPPAAGDVLKVVAEEKESMWATVYHGERLLRGFKVGKQWWFEATVEVKEAKDDDLVLSTWKFDRAVAAKNDFKKPLGFQGKTVAARRKDDGAYLFVTEDGKEVAAADAEALRRPTIALWDRTKTPGGKVDEPPPDPFTLGKSARVGQRQAVSVGGFIDRYLGRDMVEFIDRGASQASGVLESVERRDGALFGTLRFEAEIPVKQIGNLKLETAIPMRETLVVVRPIDGSSPAIRVTWTDVYKGKSTSKGPNGEVLRIEVDTTFERTLDRKLAPK